MTTIEELATERCIGVDFDTIKAVEDSMAIRDTRNIKATFPSLEIIDALTVIDNSNITLEFEQLNNISTIFMANNTLTTIPGKMRNLKSAKNIYLNGIIDTYVELLTS